MELLGVPAELTLDQQVDSGRMMPQWLVECAIFEGQVKAKADTSPLLTYYPACCVPGRTLPMAGLSITLNFEGPNIIAE